MIITSTKYTSAGSEENAGNIKPHDMLEHSRHRRNSRYSDSRATAIEDEQLRRIGKALVS